MDVRIAGLMGAAAVALGAFGAHGLKGVVADAHLLEVWDTGARYHLAHAVAMAAIAGRGASPWVMRLWLAGVALFCGSLYAMTLTGATWLGAITPLGGACFIAGWLTLAWRGVGAGAVAPR
jgi:uncharacterized membrane protein YgdD (TMEM256/DUF423 family)